MHVDDLTARELTLGISFAYGIMLFFSRLSTLLALALPALISAHCTGGFRCSLLVSSGVCGISFASGYVFYLVFKTSARQSTNVRSHKEDEETKRRHTHTHTHIHLLLQLSHCPHLSVLPLHSVRTGCGRSSPSRPLDESEIARNGILVGHRGLDRNQLRVFLLHSLCDGHFHPTISICECHRRVRISSFLPGPFLPQTLFAYLSCFLLAVPFLCRDVAFSTH